MLVSESAELEELGREHVARFDGIDPSQRHGLAAQILTASIGLHSDDAPSQPLADAPPEYLLGAPVEIDGLTLDAMRASLGNAVRALDAVSPSKAPLAQRLRELSQIQAELQRGAMLIAVEMRRALGGEGGA